MLNKVFLLILSLGLVFLSGCLDGQFSINFQEQNRPIERELLYVQDFTYKSTFRGAQKVVISIESYDSRIGLSWSNSNFAKEINMEKEIGKDYPNSGTFYFTILDPAIPNGEYDITAGIKGVKNNSSNKDKLVLAIGFEEP